jgi:micrococcal nuclease
MYEYTARLAQGLDRHPVYDGDTVRLDIDCGFGIWKCNTVCRLYGINTPEMRGADKEEGTSARDALREMLGEHPLLVRTHRDSTGKYGRYLVEIYLQLENMPMGFEWDGIRGVAILGYNDAVTWVNVNRALVVNGYAVEYMA